jgi:FtsZ-binding cell division protein ZapB
VAAGESAEYLERLTELTEENRKLKILNKGLVSCRDNAMNENASLKKQCAMYQRKIKALEK